MRMKAGKQIRRTWCRPCEQAKNKAYREANPERFLQAERKSRAKYRKENYARTREWWKANPEKTKAYGKKWQENNPDKMRALWASRHAAVGKASVDWRDTNKMREFYFAADFLGMVTGDWYHVDHIVPLRGKTVCGLHWEGNLQVLPASENVRKGNRHWPDMP